MGQWGNKPYDNDAAADWLGDLMDTTKLRAEWLKGIKLDSAKEPQTVRAAVWLFEQLGHVYVWPIGEYKSDLELAIAAAEKLRTHAAQNSLRVQNSLEMAYLDLCARRKEDPVPQAS